MMDVNNLLDQIKYIHGLPSDYKLAQLLGITLGSVRHYRFGRSQPDDRVSALMAEALGLDVDVFVMEMAAHRAKSPESRAMWSRIAARLRACPAGDILTAGSAVAADGGFSFPAHGYARAYITAPPSKEYTSYEI